MKKKTLFHPRVFTDEVWAAGYYKRNKKSIENVGKRLVKHLKSMGFEKGNVLDVGCGFAAVDIEIAKAFPEANILGIDLGDPLLDLGNNLIAEAGVESQISLQKGDALHLDYGENTYDLVINSFMVHIVEDPALMINEMERVATPEGKILITDLRRGFLALFIRKFRTAYTLQEAQEIFTKTDIRKGIFSTGSYYWDYFC